MALGKSAHSRKRLPPLRKKRDQRLGLKIAGDALRPKLHCSASSSSSSSSRRCPHPVRMEGPDPPAAPPARPRHRSKINEPTSRRLSWVVATPRRRDDTGTGGGACTSTRHPCHHLAAQNLAGGPPHQPEVYPLVPLGRTEIKADIGLQIAEFSPIINLLSGRNATSARPTSAHPVTRTAFSVSAKPFRHFQRKSHTNLHKLIFVFYVKTFNSKMWQYADEVQTTSEIPDFH